MKSSDSMPCTTGPTRRNPLQPGGSSSGLCVGMVAVLLGTFVSGCSICGTGYLDDYATVGGKWQRANPAQGRVGSPFSEPGYLAPAAATGEVYYDSDGVYYDGNADVYGDTIIENGMENDGLDGPMLPDSVIELDEAGGQMEVIPPVIELNEDW